MRLSTKVIEHQSITVTICPNGGNVKPSVFVSHVKAYVQHNVQ